MNQPELPFNQTFSVTELTSIIKEILERPFRNIKVEGEISNFKPSPSGHIYFTLKDSTSQLKAVIFKNASYNLNFKPKDGDKVQCTGNLSVYAPQGNYQLIVNKIEKAGSGDILKTLEERKQKLAAEGLFDSDKKRELPEFPKTIGVVTSPTGAAIRDILQIAKRRNPNINVIVFPAIVQGQEAAQTIVNMINIANFYNLCDVLIVGRGGGSLEDLLPFSEEIVVRAVADSKIPTISAVGHEIDWAICDYAADKRAATPSAAAEIAVPLKADIQQNLSNYREILYSEIKKHIYEKRLLINSFDISSFEIRFRSIQQPLLNRFDKARESLFKEMNDKIKDLRVKIQNNVTILENASPQTIFNRGYSMVCNAEGKIITDSAQVKPGEEIKITPAKGKITASVINNELS